MAAQLGQRTSRTLGVAGLLLGLALSYNLLSAPDDRIAGHALDALMFFGPVLLIIGGVVLAQAGNTAGIGNQRGTPALAKPILGLGFGLVLVPALLLAHSVVASSELTGFLFTITAFLFGLPGLVLIGVGISRFRNRSPSSRASSTSEVPQASPRR